MYWEAPSDGQTTRQHSVKSTSSQRIPVKPKSWDNLTTKAFGGYGFGYGYFDRGDSKTYTTSSTKSSGSTSSTQRKQSQSQPAQQPQQQRYIHPTKSTESLLLLPQYPTLSDSSLSCECLEATSPTLVSEKNGRFFTIVNGEYFYQHDKASQTESRRLVDFQQAPEVTRL